MKSRTLACLAFSLFLWGCAPYPATYYEPEFENGHSYSTATCDLGPDNGVGIEEHWGRLSINVAKQKYGESSDFTMEMPSDFQAGAKYLKIHIGIRPAEDRTIFIRQPGLSLSLDSSDYRMFKFNSFYEYTGRLRGKRPNQYWEATYTDVPFDDHSGYILDDDGGVGSIWLNVDSPDLIIIDEFNIAVGAETFVIGPIKFTKKVGVKMFTINC